MLSQHALQVVSQHALQQVFWVGGMLSQHALQVVSQHALQQVSGGAIPACLAAGLWGVPGPREGVVWPSVMAFWFGGLLIEAFWLKVVFCYGLLVWPFGTGSLLTETPFNQKAIKKITPEGHNRRPL